MLPVLEDEFEAVTVGVEHAAGVVTGVVEQPHAGLAVVGRAGGHGRGVGCIDLGPRVRDEADMRGTAFDDPRTQPEEDAPLAAEPLQVRMAGRSVRAVEIDAVADPQWRQGLRVERDRAVEVADREEDVVEHGFFLLRFQMT